MPTTHIFIYICVSRYWWFGNGKPNTHRSFKKRKNLKVFVVKKKQFCLTNLQPPKNSVDTFNTLMIQYSHILGCTKLETTRQIIAD